jgi:hypothetical protein
VIYVDSIEDLVDAKIEQKIFGRYENVKIKLSEKMNKQKISI